MKKILILLLLSPMMLVAQNRVGIGTTSPLAKLDINAQGDGAEILRFSTDRPWVFKQTHAGVQSTLTLQTIAGDKRFEILSDNGLNRAAEFLLNNTYSRVMLVPDGGEVGIGVSDASGKLHISHNSTTNFPQLRLTEEEDEFARIKFESALNPGAYWDIAGKADTITGASRLNFFFKNSTNSGDRMTILGDGKVGIGTVNPMARLDLGASGDGASVLRLSIDRAWTFKQRFTGSSTQLALQSSTNFKSFVILSQDGAHRVANFFAGNENSGVHLVPDGGKVGIGLDNPSELLHVNGTFRVDDLSGAGDRNVIVDANGKFKIGSLGAGDSDWTETTDDVYNNTHNIGIGTSSPSAKLVVVGAESNGTTAGLKVITPGTPPFYNDGNSMLFDGNEIDVLGTLNNTLYMQYNSNGGMQLVQGGGNVGIGGIPPGNKKVQITGEAMPSNTDPATASATLSIINNDGGISEMLLDGNEISTVDEDLYLNHLSGKNVIIAFGGGKIGAGTISLGSKFNIRGSDNDGTTATLELVSPNGEKMLLDGNEIEVANGALYLNSNSDLPVAIGTNTLSTGYMVNVGGKIICEEVRVQLEAVWPDYVFEDTYELQNLADVEASIKKNKHLPGIPSASQVSEEGLLLGDMQRLLLEKIEELTLHMIDLNKRVIELEVENTRLQQTQK